MCVDSGWLEVWVALIVVKCRMSSKVVMRKGECMS